MSDKQTVVINKNSSQAEELKKIDEIIKSLKFGSLTIHVEDGKVIQVDKNEKIRFK